MKEHSYPYSFECVAGHKQPVSSLLRLIHSGGKPNSMVFSGPDGVGKLLCASCYAAACLCENPNEYGACGKCNSCLSFEAGMNLNICYWFRKKQNTTIDQMRELRELASFAPVNSKYKVNIIQDGDSLNEEASNSILKTIEDSPEYLITLILYNNPGNVLPTIRSRSFSLRFQPVETDVVKEYISVHYGSSNEGSFAASASCGSIGRARMLMEATCISEARNLPADIVFGIMRDNYTLLSLSDRILALDFNRPREDKQQTVKGKQGEYIVKDGSVPGMTDDEIRQSAANYLSRPFCPDITSQENIIIFCELLAMWLRDILLIKTGGPAEQLVNSDRYDLLLKQSKAFSKPDTLAAMIQEIWEVTDRMKNNANTHLSIDSLMCRLYNICQKDRK